jgi:hypothetical protein
MFRKRMDMIRAFLLSPIRHSRSQQSNGFIDVFAGSLRGTNLVVRYLPFGARLEHVDECQFHEIRDLAVH